MIASNHENVFLIVCASNKVDVVKQNEVVSLRTMEGRAEWTWHPILFNCQEAVYTGTERGTNILR